MDKRNRLLHLSACDLVHGTPIYDIKPYVHHYDSVADYSEPAWITETIDRRNDVIIDSCVIQYIEDNEKKLKIYRNESSTYLEGRAQSRLYTLGSLTIGLKETLAVDVRSVSQTKRFGLHEAADTQLVESTIQLPFDNTVVHFVWNAAKGLVCVTNITIGGKCDEISADLSIET